MMHSTLHIHFVVRGSDLEYLKHLPPDFYEKGKANKTSLSNTKGRYINLSLSVIRIKIKQNKNQF